MSVPDNPRKTTYRDDCFLLWAKSASSLRGAWCRHINIADVKKSMFRLYRVDGLCSYNLWVIVCSELWPFLAGLFMFGDVIIMEDALS